VWVNAADSSSYYELRDGEDVVAYFGSEKPHFRSPDLRLGFCEDQLKTVADGSVDLLIDDPPYGTTRAEWDEEPDWNALADQFHRILADDGQVVVLGTPR